MGERLLCKQEVIGSIPFSSTICGCVSGWDRDPRWEKRVLAAVVPGRDVRGSPSGCWTLWIGCAAAGGLSVGARSLVVAPQGVAPGSCVPTCPAVVNECDEVLRRPMAAWRVGAKRPE